MLKKHVNTTKKLQADKEIVLVAEQNNQGGRYYEICYTVAYQF